MSFGTLFAALLYSTCVHEQHLYHASRYFLIGKPLEFFIQCSSRKGECSERSIKVSTGCCLIRSAYSGVLCGRFR